MSADGYGLAREGALRGSRRLLARMSGVLISASTLRRVTEAAGARLAAAEQDGRCFGDDQLWAWSTDRAGKWIGDLGIDGVCVLQQGPHGERQEARLAYVARVWNPPPAAADEAASIPSADGAAQPAPEASDVQA